MKKILSVICVISLSIIILCGCGKDPEQVQLEKEIAQLERELKDLQKQTNPPQPIETPSAHFYLLDSHPLFLDSAVDAQEWANNSNSYIEMGDKYSDKTKINVSCGVGWQSDFITDIQVYLHKFGVNDYSEVIQIAKEFLPMDKIEKYYTLEKLYTLADEKTPDRIRNYFAEWKLTEQGVEAYQAQSVRGTYNIVLQVDCNDKNEYTLWLHDDIPNWAWDSNLKLNGFVKSDWDISF